MKRSLWIIPLLLVWLATGRSTTKMRVIVGGMEVGSATLDHKLDAGGGMSGLMKLTMDMGGGQASIDASFMYSKTGRPKLETFSMKAGEGKTTRRVSYTATHVIVENNTNGKTSNKKIPLPKGKNLNDPSAFWFLKAKPKVGAVSKYWRYDPDKDKFTEQFSRYVGVKTISVSNRTVKAHEIKEEDGGSVWVDDKGTPLKLILMEEGTEIVFERLWK
jgi:hypothetical protein